MTNTIFHRKQTLLQIADFKIISDEQLKNPEITVYSIEQHARNYRNKGFLGVRK